VGSRVKLSRMNLFCGDFIMHKGEGKPCLGLWLLCGWTELWKEVTKIWACCEFSRNEHDISTLGELVHESMTNRLKYKHISRFEVKHIDIMEDILDNIGCGSSEARVETCLNPWSWKE
jgi:hypothetical protein